MVDARRAAVWRAGYNPAPWASTWEQIDEDCDEHLAGIRRFLQYPTVSASEDDMFVGA